MAAAGQGLSAPIDQHTASPTNSAPSKNNGAIPKLYQSGHCGAGGHGRCLGAYAGTDCSCTCHTSPPPEPPRVVVVRCFFGCPATVESTDPQAAHEAMEGHYYDTHRGDIRAAIGWMTGGAS